MLGASGVASAAVRRHGGETLSIAGAETTAPGFLQQSPERHKEETARYHGASLGASGMHSLITSQEEAPGRSHG